MHFSMQSRVASAADDGERAKLEKLRGDVEKRIRFIRQHNGMVKVTSELVQQCRDDDFVQRLDSTPYLLGVQNGVVDLRTGALRPRTPEDMIFTIIPVHYDPQADTNLISNTVLAAMADDQEMATYLQKLLGFGVTGEVCEEIFPFFTGSGRNAKGVIMQSIEELLGTRFYKVLKNGIIVDGQVSNLDAEMAELCGCRIAIFNELKPNDTLKTNVVQMLTGGDGIPATRKYMDPMVIKPRHLCILTTNHMPTINPVIPAIVERLLCIHFPVTFTDLAPGEAPSQFRRQKDITLKARLKADLKGVLKWLVDGAVMWYASKDLKNAAPAKVKDFGKKYLNKQDTLLVFIEDMCIVSPKAFVPVTEFANTLNAWAMGEERATMSTNAISDAMQLKGFHKTTKRVPNSPPAKVWVGIGLNDGVGGESSLSSYRFS